MSTSPHGMVILLHGLGANSWLTSLLASRLRRRGFQVQSWGYSSFGASLSSLIPVVRERLQAVQRQLDPQTPLHLVGHSLGAILLRGALAECELPSLRRMVWLSPPHSGSRVAARLGPLLRWLSPLVHELSDHEASAVNQLCRDVPPNVEIGTIAAEWDAVVREDSTRLGCETDHLVMRSRHSGLIFRAAVAGQIIHFLEHGCFRHDAQSCDAPAVPAD